MIVGGWEFVWAAYGVVGLGLLGYTVSLWWRLRELGNASASNQGAKE